MKRNLILGIVALLLAAFVAAPVLAKSPVVKGQVTAVGAGTITVLTSGGESVIITPPAGFDLTSIQVGDSLIAKGHTDESGGFLADWVKLTGQEAQDENTPEGSKTTDAAFCDPAKKQTPHPLAVKLAAQYAVTPEWVMGYYCNGFGMGAIMLALRTSQISGTSADELLTERSSGKGWGQIWQEHKLIGNQKDVNRPPGRLHKPDKPAK